MTPQPLAGAPKSSFASLGRRWIADADGILNASARDGEEMQKLQGELDKEIAELPRIHRELRIRRNACRPLVRLPVEIIIVIVTLAGNGLEPPEHSEWEHFMGWMKLSQVCHRIRTIILDIAGVWAKHVLAFPRTEAREEILRRTGDDLLDMTVSSPGGSGSDSDDDDDSEDSDSDSDSTSSSVPTISYVLNLLCDGWVRSLKIWAEDDEWYGTSCPQEWIELLSGQPFASLQTLVIEDSDPGQPLDHVPHCLSPNLETIRFKNAFMSWNSLALRRLSVTTEDYYFRPVSQPRFPSPDAFLALLAASPNIEDLSLGSCFPDMSAALEDGIQPFVSLPKLHKVHIKGIVSASCWLWGSLVISSTCTDVSIFIDREHHDSRSSTDIACLRRFFSLIGRDMCGPGESRRFLHTVTFFPEDHINYMNDISVIMDFDDKHSANDLEGNESPPFPRGSAGAKVRFACDRWALFNTQEDNQRDVFRSAAEAVSFRGVKTLIIHVHITPDQTEQYWKDILRDLGGVHDLYLSAPYARLFDALALPPSAPEDHGQRSCLLPALETIHIRKLYEYRPRVPATLPALQNMLSSRQRSGTGIRCLRVGDTDIQSPMSADAIRAQVEGLVSTLIWGDMPGRGLEFYERP